jgi:MSHA biogenesis protein MshE
MDSKLKLGELLVKKQLITTGDLDNLLQNQKNTQKRLSQAIVDTQLLSEEAMTDVLSEYLNLPAINVGSVEINKQVAKKLPEAFARKYQALLTDEVEGKYCVAIVDPFDLNAMDEIQAKLKKPIKWYVIGLTSLLHYVDNVYRRSGEISAFAEQLHEESRKTEYTLSDLELDKANVDAPVVKFLRSVFEDAIQVNASDIHIEPDDEVLRIRLRVNGVLQEQIVKEKEIMSSVALRLKLMSGLNIAERRIPQDGRFHINLGEKILDVRLSTLPTQFGESIVMRLLDQSGELLDLKKIGLPERELGMMQKLINSPSGILLVTGPTGSGKSTTLYAALNLLNEPGRKIITVEDPIEYQLPRVNQVQINEKTNLTFSVALRSIFRQDPDVVLVGEMRDNETAEIAIKAALTGHLVFSTLHTNDAPGSALRLLDMNIDGFLLASTLRGILAQRLIRFNCTHCKEAHMLTEFEESWLLGQGIDQPKQYQFQDAKGCGFCNYSGHGGRTGVFELLVLDDEMKEMLRKQEAGEFIRRAKKVLKGRTLIHQAIAHALKGEISLYETLLLAGEERFDG